MAVDPWGFEEGSELAPGRSVVRSLGGGNRFEVLLVWDEGLYALAVAKVLRPHLVEREGVLEDLRDEAELLARLAHPVIVRGFGAVLDGPRPHLLIEHLEGPTLRRLIRRGGPIPLEQLLPLAAHVGAALRYMELNGVAHLDVKPDNIVMGIPPRLIDLSIARPLERAVRIRKPIGTDAYMPPEQCDPSGHLGEIGAPSDVWGLGATLHHALSGSPPFPRPKEARESDDPHVRFPQLVEDPRPLPGRLPDGLGELIAACLRKRPEDRISAADLVDGLGPLVAALPRKLVLGRRGGPQGVPMKPAAKVFLDLAADGVEAEDQRSLSRKTLAILAAAVLMISVPLLWAASDQRADAAPVKQAAVAGEDDDDDESGGDDDDSEAGDDGTLDGTGTASDNGTGEDTVGNTDAGGQDTGKSTQGETDGADGTGQSEATEGTGAETQGNTDDAAGAEQTGASTQGETDGQDDTGKTENV